MDDYSDKQFLNDISDAVFQQNVAVGWWNDLDTGEPLYDSEGNLRKNVYEVLCLIHSEVSEAAEAFRKGLSDKHLPNRTGFECELADILIRVFDISGAMQLDLHGAVIEKLAYNASREDHKLASRKAKHGKKV